MIKNFGPRIAVLLLFSAPFFFFIQPWIEFGIFFLGLWLGAAMLLLDELWLSSWYQSGPASGEKSVETPPQLITRSVVFMAVYMLLTVFVVTSTGSLLGIGTVLGIGVLLSLELWQARHNLSVFQAKFGWQTAYVFTAATQRNFTWAFIFFVLLCCLWAVF